MWDRPPCLDLRERLRKAICLDSLDGEMPQAIRNLEASPIGTVPQEERDEMCWILWVDKLESFARVASLIGDRLSLAMTRHSKGEMASHIRRYVLADLMGRYQIEGLGM